MRKHLNKALFIILVLCAHIPVKAQQGKDPQPMNAFIGALMKKMTLNEKLGQLNLITPFLKTGPFATKKAFEKLKDGSAGNVYGVIGTPSGVHSKLVLADSTRLKIPLLSGLDIIHGYKTIFPIPLGLSCSWDTTLIEQTARVAAIEASAVGYNWTFSPMVDLTRDPRWGRVMEGAGEDPYLGGLIARAMVKGYQGNDLRNETSLMACVKHFGMYGAAEAGRDYNTTDMSRLTMYQFYLSPYKAVIDAGAGSIMSSFNDIEGVPATANKWLLTDLLRKEWGFKGFVVTDFNAIQELINHGVAKDYMEAAVLALNAGVDMDMGSESMIASLKQSLKERKVTVAQIDAACRSVLEAKYKLGLFTNPYRNYDPDKAARVTLTEHNKEVAKQAALKSIVLLKNSNNTLPLQQNTNIALIGPFADNKQEMFSMWSFMGDTKSVVTILDGIRKQNSNVMYAQGTQVSDDSVYIRKNRFKYDPARQQQLVNEAIAVANKSDIIVAVLGEPSSLSGEATSRTEISIPNCQRELLKALHATGKPVVLLLANGRPLTIQNDLQFADAVVETWRLGTEAGNAVADVLFGNYNPSGKLTMTFPRSVGQIPIYYNHKNTGRPYVEGGPEEFVSNYKDQYNTPLYPFGYGLSYTTFSYSNVALSDTLLAGSHKTLKATITITNTGRYSGEEIVQLYLNDPVASVARPVKELKQFKKVFLQSGEAKTIVFTITPEDLKFYNSKLVWDWEPGAFKVFIGGNSENVKAAKFVWTK
ncbi:MAG TPA: beta-glucosidase BglX [Niabella sp.]|nr:beta-glucosidase BglX [Niabella sp.]HOZ97845.1 beta-glucosidase BglX [Niabella sp.]HQW15683.1 beta-glucosidase BglX [Niabella sp.]HQX20800.1 beta-glucosidase BglX [Niabella sp.]HQX41384.1 beta-glucosidase BglX [Niabella sp.]